MCGYTKTLLRCTGATFGMTYNGICLGVRLDFDSEPFGGISWMTPALDTFDKAKDRRVGTAYGFDFLLQLFNALDIEKLDDLKGRYFYALSNGPTGWGHSSSEWAGFERLGMDGGKRLIFKDIAAEWMTEGDGE